MMCLWSGAESSGDSLASRSGQLQEYYGGKNLDFSLGPREISLGQREISQELLLGQLYWALQQPLAGGKELNEGKRGGTDDGDDDDGDDDDGYDDEDEMKMMTMNDDNNGGNDKGDDDGDDDGDNNGDDNNGNDNATMTGTMVTMMATTTRLRRRS